MNQKKFIQKQSGFTLVEMAIVLMIVGLLLGGMLVPLSAQMEQRNNSDTQKALSEIKEAIIGYALANGRLPCPATGTIPTGQTGAGTEAITSGACTNVSGVLPWATLGVNETDAWGNRYTYRVDTNFSDSNSNNTYGSGCSPSPAPANASFALCSLGTLNVLSAVGGTTIAGNVPAVIISHGKNGAGAYTQQGTPLPASSDPDEQENSNGNPVFVTHTPTPTFDDLVVWISPNILYNRMVAAGKLP